MRLGGGHEREGRRKRGPGWAPPARPGRLRGLGQHTPQPDPLPGPGGQWGLAAPPTSAAPGFCWTRGGPRRQSPLATLEEDENGEARPMFKRASPGPAPDRSQGHTDHLSSEGVLRSFSSCFLLWRLERGLACGPPEPPALCPPPCCARVAGDSLTEGAGVWGRLPGQPRTLAAISGQTGRGKVGIPGAVAAASACLLAAPHSESGLQWAVTAGQLHLPLPQAHGLGTVLPRCLLAPAAAPSWVALALGRPCVAKPGPACSHALSLLLHEAASLHSGCF